jgi:hypothetical protein
MRVTSSKPKGQRIFKSMKFKRTLHNGKTIKIRRPLWIEPEGPDWWFDLATGQWVEGYNGIGGMTTSYYAMTYDGYHNVYSLKAAKRLIAKWNVPKGTKFRVSLPFVGYEFIITK